MGCRFFSWLRAVWRYYRERTNEKPLEAFLGELTFLWGFWLFLPMDSFGAAPAFAAMAHLPEWFWGGGAMILGAMMLRGILRGWRRPLRWGFIGAGGLWFLVVSTLVFANWATTGTPIYALIAISVFRRGSRM